MTGRLLIGVWLIASCQQVSAPIERVDSASETTANATSSSATQGPQNAPEGVKEHPLPACQPPGGRSLQDLTLAVSTNWDGDDEIYFIQADGSNLAQVTFIDAMSPAAIIWANAIGCL